EQSIPLRLRATELALALLTGSTEIASGKAAARAIRSITAMDDIDRRLLELANTVQQIQEQRKEKALSPEEIRTKEVVNALLARAEDERKQKIGKQQD